MKYKTSILHWKY